MRSCRVFTVALVVFCLVKIGWGALFPVVREGIEPRQSSSVAPESSAAKKTTRVHSLKDKSKKARTLFREGNYVPPRVVLELLENPTPENAHRYLLWVKRREQAVRKAMTLVQKVAIQEARARIHRKENDLNIFFFYSGTCPHCIKASRELAKVMMEFPNLKVTPVRLGGSSLFLRDIHGGQARALAQRAGVVAVPLYLISYKGQVYRLVGEKTAYELEDFLAYQVGGEGEGL